MPTQQDMMLVTEKMMLESVINNKFIADYGTIKSISSDGKTCDVQHMVLQTFGGKAIDTPLLTREIEILYMSSSSISFDVQPKEGDPVLLIGLKRNVPSTSTPMPLPAKPISNDSYDMSTMKAIPLSAINGASGVTFRAKDGKLRIRNSTVSLYKALNDLTSAISAFSSLTSQSALTATNATGGGFTVGLVTALNLLLSTMNTSLVSVANEISSLLED